MPNTFLFQIHQIHKVKGLLPDEEKEKIGPKPATNRRTTTQVASPDSKTIKQPPSITKTTSGVVLKSAPTPANHPPPTQPNPPPQQPAVAMTPLPPTPGIIPQNPMMMMPPIRPQIMGKYFCFA